MEQHGEEEKLEGVVVGIPRGLEGELVKCYRGAKAMSSNESSDSQQVAIRDFNSSTRAVGAQEGRGTYRKPPGESDILAGV